ncbi:hypothetical protein [Mariniblastus fucicola]|uniref:Uncharacterized protein n=1 Tax=Mariniblastus fucicola TaxID=980251 RepID=A0A5B9PFC9_9BACT|nr:hypothetical protein [Mariniblastus fucicola]QEG25128.1 hypothetical protein MFFC18_50510 [Mariniblastus fucicola]
MDNPIDQRWKEYCMQISETARKLSEKSSLGDAIKSALEQFMGNQAPANEEDYESKVREGDQLIDGWNTAYKQSENHGSIASPTQCMAEQAELARDNIES